MSLRIDILEKVVLLCEKMNTQSQKISASNQKMIYAKNFFKKGTLHGRSLLILLEVYREENSFDLATISAIGRTIIETHNVFLYLTEPKIDKREIAFRIALLHLNQSVDLIRISSALGIKPTDSRLGFQEFSKDFSIDDLQSNRIFQSLSDRQRKHLLKGKYPYLMERYEGERPISQEIESAVYNLFSHNVHSFGLSNSYIGLQTPAGFKNLLILAVEIAIIFLAHLAKKYQSIRARALRKMDTNDRAFDQRQIFFSFNDN